jgi:tripartite-type tricarboxylate transporter receptor subunit TctC
VSTVFQSFSSRVLALCAIAALCATTAGAQAYPTKPIRMVVGYPAGSGIDNVARQVALRIEKAAGQPVVIDNKPGALCNIGAQTVATAPNDGYTILFTPNSTHAANIHLFKHLPFDPVKDFTPISTVATLGFVLLVNPEIQPVHTVAELVAVLKSRPGKLAWGSGNATGQVAGELFKTLAGVDAVNVPYKGVPQAMTDLIGGRIDYLFADATLAIPQLKGDNRVRALAVTNKVRPAAMADIPTLAEAGVKGYDLTGWFAIFMPANVPPAVAKKMTDMVQVAVKDPALRVYLESIGAEPFPGTPDQLASLVASDTLKWGKIIDAAGIRAE